MAALSIDYVGWWVGAGNLRSLIVIMCGICVSRLVVVVCVMTVSVKLR